MEALIQADEMSRRSSPGQGGQVDTGCVKPGRLARPVAKPSLLDAARPSTLPIGDHPSAVTWRQVELERSPGMASLGVLENAAPFSHRRQRCSKAAVVVAQLEPRPGAGASAPITAPAFAGRMGDDRIRPFVEARVARLGPQINIGKAAICALLLDKKGGDHINPRILRRSCLPWLMLCDRPPTRWKAQAKVRKASAPWL